MHVEHTHSSLAISEPITRWQGQISKKVMIMISISRSTTATARLRGSKLRSPEKVLMVWWIIEAMDPDTR
jgi:hypothetical protein